jgi:replicative DNA helicase
MSTKLDGIILNYALREKKFMMELSKAVKADYFDPKFQLFYSLVLENFANPKIKEVLSQDALADYALSKGLAKQVPTLRKIYEKAQQMQVGTAGQSPPPGDFGYYLSKFKDRHNKAVVEMAAEEINKGIDDGLDADELNKIITSTMFEISAINQVEVFDEGDIGSDAINMYDEYVAIESSPDEYKGILLGFDSFDQRTNGLQGGELMIIAGMEGTGKSALMMNMGINAWMGDNGPTRATYTKTGHNVLYFTLEMPRSNRGEFTSGAYLNKRILAAVSKLEFESIRKGKLDDSQKEHLKHACEFMSSYSKENQFYVVDIPRGARMEDIEVKYLELKESMDIDLVIIDYIGIMAGADRDENDWQAQGNVAADMHEFARTYNVPVMTAVQLNRPPKQQSLTKANESLNNTRVARSAMITQNANIVLAIGCRDNEEAFPDMPIFITKMRDGRKGPLTFSKKLNCMLIEDGFVLNLGDGDDLSEFEDFSLGDEFNVGEASE